MNKEVAYSQLKKEYERRTALNMEQEMGDIDFHVEQIASGKSTAKEIVDEIIIDLDLTDLDDPYFR